MHSCCKLPEVSDKKSDAKKFSRIYFKKYIEILEKEFKKKGCVSGLNTFRIVINSKKKEYEIEKNYLKSIGDEWDLKDEDEVRGDLSISELMDYLSQKVDKPYKCNIFIILIEIILPNGIDSHTNLAIVNRERKMIDYFEPHGSELESEFQKIDYGKHSEYVIKNILLKGTKSFTFNFNNVSCPFIGLQKIESVYRIKNKLEGGFCTAWCLYIAHIYLLNNQQFTIREIEEFLIKEDKEMINKRGYIKGEYLYNLITKYIKKIEDIKFDNQAKLNFINYDISFEKYKKDKASIQRHKDLYLFTQSFTE